MSTTIAGVPRVKLERRHKARPIQEIGKRADSRKKKNKDETDNLDEIDQAWRKK